MLFVRQVGVVDFLRLSDQIGYSPGKRAQLGVGGFHSIFDRFFLGWLRLHDFRVSISDCPSGWVAVRGIRGDFQYLPTLFLGYVAKFAGLGLGRDFVPNWGHFRQG